MATTLKTKNSVTALSAPVSLVQGELAVNITDKKIWVGNASSTPVLISDYSGSIIGGSNTQVQYNNSGVFAGSANFTFNGTTVTIANDASISGLTVGKGGGAVGTNTAIGLNALSANTTGSQNTAVGANAADAITTGTFSVAFGTDALGAAQTSTQNSALGWKSLEATTTGESNTAVGSQAMRINTTGTANTSVGREALYSNTTASNNTAVGYQAGYSNTTAYALAAFGYQAAYSNTTGLLNTAIGSNALYYNTTGSSNTAIGQAALQANTTASNNTAVGYQAGYTNSTGGFNTLFGYQAGRTLTGANNTIIGASAGYSLTTGVSNCFIGATGARASGELMTTGSKNTIIGSYDGNFGGLDIRTASNYIVLSDGDGNPRAWWDTNGVMYAVASLTDNTPLFVRNTQATRPYGMEVNFSAASPNNTTQSFFLGTDSTNTKVVIYSSGTISNRTGTYNTISDAKLKENIVDATPKLDKLMDVKVRNYNLIGDELKQIGFVAQELETVFPALIDNVPDLDENKQPTGEVTKGVKLTVMIPILVKAIQELKAEVDSIKAQLAK